MESKPIDLGEITIRVARHDDAAVAFGRTTTASPYPLDKNTYIPVEELPEAVEVMDPSHVVKLAGDTLHEVRRRIQQETAGHHGRAKDPLYRAKRTLHTGTDLLTTKQQEQTAGLFVDSNFTDLGVTWAVY